MPRPKYKRPVRAVKGAPRPAFDWSKIERAYGRAIPEPARQSMELAARAYVALAQAEAGGLSVKGTKRQLERLTAAANALWTELDQDRLTAEFLEPYCDLDRVRSALIELRDGCRRAHAALDTLRPQRTGDARRAWIRDLAAICNEHDLPSEVRQDGDAYDRHSPFTLLVRELQRALPPQHRYSARNEIALAKAILRDR